MLPWITSILFPSWIEFRDRRLGKKGQAWASEPHLQFSLRTSDLNISTVYCIACSPPQVSFHHHLSPLYLLRPPPAPFLSGNMLLSVSLRLFFVCLFVCLFCLIPSPFFNKLATSLPSDSCFVWPGLEVAHITLKFFCKELNHMTIPSVWNAEKYFLPLSSKKEYFELLYLNNLWQ